MAASIPGDGVPGKLERARSNLHTLAGSALLIGSTVMRPDNTAEELPKDRAFEAMFSDELGRAMFDQHDIVELLPEDPEKEQKIDSVLGKNTPVSRASCSAKVMFFRNLFVCLAHPMILIYTHCMCRDVLFSLTFLHTDLSSRCGRTRSPKGGWAGGEEREAARSRMGRPLGAGAEPVEIGEIPLGEATVHGVCTQRVPRTLSDPRIAR